MSRIVLSLSVLVLGLFAARASAAEDWATKMFNTTSHDFGTVAKGANAQFHFAIKNPYKEDVHITGVRSSCGCTKPDWTRDAIKTFDKGEVVAELDTQGSYQGNRSATLTVTFDKPFAAEVQLTVTAEIRGDVVIQPGLVDLGTVECGKVAEQHVSVSYAGRSDWELLDVRSANPHLEVELKKSPQGAGRIVYDVLVRLTEEAPVGFFKDQLVLVTNDARSREIPVVVQGRVISDITINPESLNLGVVKPGQKVQRRLLVVGKRPFKIVHIKCDDDAFEIEAQDEAKKVHYLPVVYTAGDTPGKIQRQIALETDLGESVTPTFTAYGQVVAKSGKASGDGEK